MKVLINGVEAELILSGGSVQQGPDRLMVRTAEGTFSALAVHLQGKTLISFRGRTYTIEPATRKRAAGAASSGDLKAPMPGVVVDVLVKAGDAVTKGQKLVVVEAMKTQQPFVAPFDGRVAEVPVQKNQQILEGSLLVKVEVLPTN